MMKSAIKRHPAKLDSTWAPPQSLWRFTSFLVFALMFSTSYAANFCVSTMADLQNALATAANNGENNVIQIVQGTDLSNFHAVTEGANLSIETGYTADCASRLEESSNTVSAPPPLQPSLAEADGTIGNLLVQLSEGSKDEPQPEAIMGNGHITGMVTDGGGNPLAGIQVFAYSWNGSSWDWINGDSTDASGSYDIDSLATGNYRVRFRDNSGAYAVEYYNDAGDIDNTAMDIAVTTGMTTSGIDAQLVLAAHITGTVTDTAGNPLLGIDVAAYRWNGNHWIWLNADLTDAAGSYDIGGLNTGTYHVRFRDPSGTYATEFYNNAPDIISGTNITSTAGMSTPNINAQLAYAGNITGTVTDTAGNPLEGIQVAAHRWNGTNWVWVNADMSDSAGNYDIGDLNAGTYRVRFRDNSGTYAVEYYNDVPDIGSAMDIAVTFGTPVTGIDAQLDLAAHITGTVTNSAGTPSMGIEVSAYRWNGSKWVWLNFVSTDASGNYDVGGLSTGTYHVRFRDPSGTYVSEFYDNAADIISGTDIALTAGTTTPNINAQLAYAGNITGTVTDTAGNPLVGISVLVFRWDGTHWVWATSGITDAAGNYDIGDLNTGTYRVGFKDFSWKYALEYYDDMLDFNHATDIPVTVGTPTTGIDAQLALAGNISGTVTDTTGNPLAGIHVWAYRWNGSNWFPVNLAITDASGYYEIKILAAGNYRIKFSDPSGSYAYEYYDDVLDISSSTDVPVTAENTTPNINAQLSLKSNINGTVTDSSGNPLANIEVMAYYWNGTYWEGIHSDLTDSAGRYDFEGLLAGDYRLRFRDASGTYATEYYDDAPNFESATDIVVTTNTTISNINAQLGMAAHITGTVTEEGSGNPLEGIQVAIYRDGNWLDADLTDASGNYDLGGLNTDTYRLRFRDNSGTYATEYYDDMPYLGSATDIMVTVGMTTNIDAQLDLAGHITGMLTDCAGNPLMGIDVAAYRWWNGSDWLWLNSGVTDASGNYDVGGLSTGTYHVRFRDPSRTYPTEFYNNAPNLLSGTDIAVTEGMITPNIKAQMGTCDVIIDFGDPYGIWMRMNNITWVKLHPLSPESMVTGDIDGSGQDDVIIDFGAPYGIWARMNNTTWVQLDIRSPESMVTGDLDGSGQDDVIIDFGSDGIWVWMNNSTLVQLDSRSADSMVTGDIDGNGLDDVIIDFGAPDGIWVWMNNSTLVQLDTRSAESMVTGDIDGNGLDDVIIDFGSDGIWVRMNNSVLVQLHSISPESMVTGDIDGNGQDDIIIDFGAPYGIWLWMNNSSWVQLHSISPESMVTGDIDGNGQDDIIIDFGAPYGIWVWMNNSTWDHLHSISPDSMVTGNID